MQFKLENNELRVSNIQKFSQDKIQRVSRKLSALVQQQNGKLQNPTPVSVGALIPMW